MGYIRGKVFDNAGNEIRNAVVRCPGLNLVTPFAQKGNTGTYFGYGAIGKYKLTASAKNYKTTSKTVRICNLLQEENLCLPPA